MPHKDPEKHKQYQREYQKKYKRKNPVSQKTNRKCDWKRNGVKDDLDILWSIFSETDNCQICDVKLTTDKINTKTTKTMNHCHETGYFLNILCNSCNYKGMR